MCAELEEERYLLSEVCSDLMEGLTVRPHTCDKAVAAAVTSLNLILYRSDSTIEMRSNLFEKSQISTKTG